MEDIRGFVEEEGGGIDISKLTKKWKPIAIVILGIIVIALLGYAALDVVNAAPVAMSFEEPKISAGESTKLTVVVVNTGEVDAQNVVIQVIPESAVINVTDPQRTELVIGSKAKRQFEFEVTVLTAATPGTYKLTAKASKIGEEEKIATAYLEVE